MAFALKGPLSRGEAALVLGVSKHTVRRWERKGLLKATYHNRRVVRYDHEEVSRLKPFVCQKPTRKLQLHPQP